MDLYFAGTEIKGWRTLLESNSVVHVGLSYMGLRRRRKNPLDFKIADEYHPGMSVYLDSGAATVNKDDETTKDAAYQLACSYYEFALANLDRIEFASEFNATVFGREMTQELRVYFGGQLGDKLMPIWDASQGRTALRDLADQYPRVGVLQSSANDDTILPVLRSIAGQTKLHGVSMTSMQTMRDIPWSSAATGSWLNVTQYGETFVWTGREMKWYPKRQKETARKAHRTWLSDQGFDADAIEADDSAELLKLSIWSWNRFSESLTPRQVVTKVDILSPFGNEENDPEGVSRETPALGNGELAVSPPKKLLPVVGFSFHTSKDADGTEVQTPIMETPASGVLQCDTCYMRDKCPAMTPGSECHYEIPIKVRTAAQLAAVQDSLIEMQTQRVVFMRMVEQSEGGYMDENLSREIERLNKMIKTKQDAGKEGFSVNIQNIQAPGGSGMIGRILGRDVTDRMGALPAGEIESADIIEATIVDEGSN